MLLDRSRHDEQAGLADGDLRVRLRGLAAGRLRPGAGPAARAAARAPDHPPAGAERGTGRDRGVRHPADRQVARKQGSATPRYDGVTGVWYGKAPGLDRATDALRHANLIGTTPTGGAVALVGDDPAAKSSTVPCCVRAGAGRPRDADVLPGRPGRGPAARPARGRAVARQRPVVGDQGRHRRRRRRVHRAGQPRTGTPPDLSDLPGGLRAYRHRPSARLLGAELAELERGQQLTRLPIALEYIRRSGLNTDHRRRRKRGSAWSPRARPTSTCARRSTRSGSD